MQFSSSYREWYTFLLHGCDKTSWTTECCPGGFPESATKGWYRKWLKHWHDKWEKFVKISCRHRLVCFPDFDGTNLCGAFFLLPPRKCFLRVCLPTFSAAVLNLLLTLTASAICGSSNSNKLTPTRFAAVTISSHKMGIVVLPITSANALNLLPRCRSKPLKAGFFTCSEATILMHLYVWGFLEHQNKASGTDRYIGHFFIARVSQVNENCLERVFEVCNKGC